jgi:DNA-binding PadR family transcriptional regulator
MRREIVQLETHVREALREEAAALEAPATLWSRLEAQVSRPITSPPLPASSLAALEELAGSGMPRRLSLALLGEQEMDSFTLARRVEDVARRAGCAAPGEATLLPLLHQLEREGLVRARWRQGSGGMRRVYSLQERGRRMRVLAAAIGWLPRLGRHLGPATQRNAQCAEESGG